MRCVREITGIWRAAAVLCAAAFATAWCLAFPFAPAYADEGGAGASADDDTIVVSVPTTVLCALLSDGTVATPTSWKVENSGSTPARLAMATATTAYDGISASAKAGGSTLLDYSGGFASYDPILVVPAKGSLDVSWAVSRLDPAAHADLFEQASQHPVTLLSASFLFCAQSTEPSASDSVPFAVYSEDDASLTFYKRRALPVEGSVFEGKTATGGLPPCLATRRTHIAPSRLVGKAMLQKMTQMSRMERIPQALRKARTVRVLRKIRAMRDARAPRTPRPARAPLTAKTTPSPWKAWRQLGARTT